ncbi:MAG: hypothetical protein GXP13_07695 [Gammaproteobacteria bacterium]|nr:hypothetical protein [Gammaproteobacteria bacterium]
MNTILAIDQGTHASRALLFDQNGNTLKSAVKPVAISRKNNGVVEQDATEILESVNEVIHRVLDNNSVQVNIAALTTQRSTLVAWDSRTGNPLAPAISWQDRRCARLLEDLKPQASKIHRITGLPLSPHYLGGKINWLLKHNQAVINARQHQCLLMGSLSSFLCFHLLENQPFIIDHSNAARSLLFDLTCLGWNQELLQLFNIPETILPECVPTLYNYGKIKDYEIPLACVCGDQNSAIYANGNHTSEDIFINIGTGAFILQPQNKHVKHHPRLLTGIARSHLDQANYLLEGTVNGAGSSLSTLQKTWPEQDLIQSLPVWLNEISNPPLYLNGTGGLGSPWWVKQLDNQFIPECNTIEEQAVSVVESIVFMLIHNHQLLNTSNTKAIHVSGGLSRLDGICQKIADLARLPVIRCDNKEASARGAAWLVAHPDSPWITTQPPEKFTPACNPTLEQRYQKYTVTLLKILGENASWYQDDCLKLTSNTITPEIVAHRGYQKHYPENTIESVVAAIKAGANCIEIDIQLCKDNTPMVFHDESLFRTTGLNGSIFDYTSDELLKLDANEKDRLGSAYSGISIPTLDSLINVIKQHKDIHFFIEIKQQTLDRFGISEVMNRIIRMINPYSNNCTIISFDKDCLHFVKQNSHIPIGWVLHEYNQTYIKEAQQLNPEYLICNHKKLTHPRPAAGPWQWMLYEVNTIKLADKLYKAGVNYISTADVDTLTMMHKKQVSNETI